MFIFELADLLFPVSPAEIPESHNYKYKKNEYFFFFGFYENRSESMSAIGAFISAEPRFSRIRVNEWPVISKSASE